MDAVAYQMSFDKEQLALLCANYDRCIDSLGAENKRLKADNAKLRELIGMIGNVCDGTSEVCEYCKNYSATNDECMMLKQMRELGVEVNDG